MAFQQANMPPLVLTTSGATSTSNALGTIDDIFALSIAAPASLTSTGVFVQVEQSSAGTSYVQLQSGGVDVQIAPGKAIVISPFPFKQVTLVSTVQEAAPRTFSVSRIFQT